MSTRQGSGAFNSITDGQPGSPRGWEVGAILSYDDGERDLQSQFEVDVTWADSGFWCQSLFSVAAPTLAVGEALIDFERSVSLSWLQRWRVDDRRGPTVSTMVALQLPYDEPGQETDLTVTGVLVKSVSRATFYANVSAETSGGIALDRFELGSVVGVKHAIREDLSVFFDVVIQEPGDYAAELSFEWDLANGFALGPGIALTHSAGDSGLDPALGIQISR